MSGIFIRAQLDGKWQPLEIEYLSDEQRAEFFKGRSEEEMIRWINALCNALKDIESLYCRD